MSICHAHGKWVIYVLGKDCNKSSSARKFNSVFYDNSLFFGHSFTAKLSRTTVLVSGDVLLFTIILTGEYKNDLNAS